MQDSQRIEWICAIARLHELSAVIEDATRRMQRGGLGAPLYYGWFMTEIRPEVEALSVWFSAQRNLTPQQGY